VTITPTDAERLAEAQAEVARLNKWADGFSDAQLKERQLCEELLREKDTTIATLRQERDEARAEVERLRWADESDAAAAKDMQAAAMAAQDFIIAKGLWDEFSEAQPAERTTPPTTDDVPNYPDPGPALKRAALKSSRLVEPVQADDVERARRDKLCFVCAESTDSFAANPNKWPVKLGNDRTGHVGCIRQIVDSMGEVGRILADHGFIANSTHFAVSIELALTAARAQGFKDAIEKTTPGWRDLHTALRMIREAVEELGPVGAAPSRDVGPPDYIKDAEEIIGGIQRIGEQAHAQGVREGIERCVDHFMAQGDRRLWLGREIIAVIRALATPETQEEKL